MAVPATMMGVPKEGPSAGITIVTRIVSALKGVPVRNDLAMTGEITIMGKVLGIGGILPKLQAAVDAGCKEVIVPKENERDVQVVPDYIRNRIKIRHASTIDDVLAAALVQPKNCRGGRPGKPRHEAGQVRPHRCGPGRCWSADRPGAIFRAVPRRQWRKRLRTDHIGLGRTTGGPGSGRVAVPRPWPLSPGTMSGTMYSWSWSGQGDQCALAPPPEGTGEFSKKSSRAPLTCFHFPIEGCRTTNSDGATALRSASQGTLCNRGVFRPMRKEFLTINRPPGLKSFRRNRPGNSA